MDPEVANLTAVRALARGFTNLSVTAILRPPIVTWVDLGLCKQQQIIDKILPMEVNPVYLWVYGRLQDCSDCPPSAETLLCCLINAPPTCSRAQRKSVEQGRLKIPTVVVLGS